LLTHPYTPQENGHVESFHSILSKHLKRYIFWSLEELEQNLVLFYEFYNNERLHGSIAYTNPQNFWLLWKHDKVAMKVDEKKRKINFKLKVPHHHLHQFTGNNEPEAVSQVRRNLKKRPYIKIQSLINLRHKKSPSVVSRCTKINTNHYICIVKM